MLLFGTEVSRHEFFGHRHHSAEHSAYFFVAFRQFGLKFWGHVFAIAGKIEPDLSFGRFAIGIREFADEHLWILPFAESLGDVGGDASG